MGQGGRNPTFGTRAARRETASAVLDFKPERDAARLGNPSSAQSSVGTRTSRIRPIIQTLVSIAADHGSSISSAELLVLLPEGVFDSSTDLESFVKGDASLGHELKVLDGQITLRGFERLARGRPDQVRLSEQRALTAQAFSDRLMIACPWIRVVGISGSTAYAGSKSQDDVDFYLVTGPNRLWITLLFAMISARFHRLKSPDSPPFCFNRILEENECRDAFRSNRDPLFAREALNLRILQGRDHFREILSSATWMERLFPGLFRQALGPAIVRKPKVKKADRRLWSIVNGVAFASLAPYLTIVGIWRNHRLQRAGRVDARFRTITRRGFFAYESKKYDLLRDTYSKVF
jgi:hypothetical protein